MKGLLWQDDNYDSDAVVRAVTRYREKYGLEPGEVRVNAAMDNADIVAAQKIVGIPVSTSKTIPNYHIFVIDAIVPTTTEIPVQTKLL